MSHYSSFVVAIIFTVLGSIRSDLSPCEEGYQIARTYTECWTQATFANKKSDLYQPREVYTKEFVEEYARHMCSVVKPQAIECLRESESDCPNIQKIVEMADESGGTCVHNELNSFFKLHIIDHLASVRSDSPCFNITGDSDCYNNAAKKVRQKGVSISRFHYEADRMFAFIWECQVKLYKSHSDICKNWQLPMLLSLQRMAMPSLFGMKLTEEHAGMLELEPIVPTPRTTPSTANCDNEAKGKIFILLKVSKQRPEAVEGGTILEVDLEDSLVDGRTLNKQIIAQDRKKKKEKQTKTQQKERKEKGGKKDTVNDDNQMIN